MTKLYTKKTVVLLVTIALTGFLFSAQAQLTVQGGQTPQYLVQNVLVGQGVIVSNINFLSDPSQQIGSFNGQNSNIGINSGIILSSGNINNAPGPNNSTSSATMMGLPGDADLDNLTTSLTEDAAVLTFDFVSINDTVVFNYVFASEEYPEFVNSSFNDVFAFFISGPGYPQPTNIALIPGTATPVTINNVNVGLNSQYYVDNTNGNSVQYDAFTVKLTAMAIVQPCSTYTLKIAVADAGDDSYDSAVFLEAGSFSAVGSFSLASASVGPTSGALDSTLLEGCNNGQIIITRIANFGDTIVVPITYGGTANSGTDYNGLPASVTFYPGDTTVTVPITILTDNLTEGQETIIITLSDPTIVGCSNLTLTATLYINDVTPLQVNITPPNANSNGCSPIQLTANVVGGTGAFIYTWDNGLPATASVSVNPGVTTTYTVIVTDACQIVPPDTQSVTITVNVGTITAAITATQTNIVACDGTSVTISASGQGGVPPYTYTWNNGLPSAPSNIVSPVNTTTYEVVVGDACNSIVDTVQVTVNVTNLPPIQAQAQSSASVVTGCGSVVLTASGAGGNGSYLYNWLNAGVPDQQVVTVFPLANTVFTVIVSDTCGSVVDTAEVTISFIPDTITAGILPTDTTIYCGTPLNLAAFASGGQGSLYLYSWDTDVNDSTQAVIVTPLSTTTYTVTVTDTCGSIAGVATANVTVECDVIAPNVFTPNGDTHNDYLVFANLEAYPNSILTIFNRWGRKIYDNPNYQNNWDGGDYSEGVYYFILDIPAKPQKIHGTVTIIR